MIPDAPKLRQSPYSMPKHTSMLAFIIWWGFLSGHVANNIMGFGS
jgi:hypothetical protein